jgi:hypothetical protein
MIFRQRLPRWYRITSIVAWTILAIAFLGDLSHGDYFAALVPLIVAMAFVSRWMLRYSIAGDALLISGFGPPKRILLADITEIFINSRGLVQVNYRDRDVITSQYADPADPRGFLEALRAAWTASGGAGAAPDEMDRVGDDEESR